MCVCVQISVFCIYLVIVHLLTIFKEINSSNFFIVKKIILHQSVKGEAGEMAQLSIFVALSQDLSSVISTHIGQLPVSCQQLKIQGLIPSLVFGLHTHIHKNKIKIKIC